MLTTVNIAPFLKVQALHHHISAQASPFLLRKSKRRSEHRGKLSGNCSYEEKDNFSFDDSEYFNQLNRPSTQQKKVENLSERKGDSQIIKIKKMHKQSAIQQISVFNLSTLLQKNIDNQDYKPLSLKKSSFSLGCKSQKPQKQANYKNQFICSPKKKSYATLDQKIIEKPLPNDFILNQTIDNQNQSPLIEKDHFNTKRSKSFSINKSCAEINEWNSKKYLNRHIKKGKNQYDSKRSQSWMHYSILKPNQIKTIPLTCRKEFKNHENLKVNDQKQLYMEMVLQIKRKQDFLKKQMALQKQKELFYKEQRQIDIRSKIHTSYTMRRGKHLQQKNDLNPWQVEGNFNLTDII